MILGFLFYPIFNNFKKKDKNKMNTSVSNTESDNASLASAIVPTPGDTQSAASRPQPTLSLESVCEYACHVPDDKEA